MVRVVRLNLLSDGQPTVNEDVQHEPIVTHIYIYIYIMLPPDNGQLASPKHVEV
jgi:hypothetical protein